MSVAPKAIDEKLSRVYEWRAEVLSVAEKFSSSFSSCLDSASIDQLFEALAKVDRHDRDTSLQVMRRLIAAIVTSEHTSAQRAKLLENCYSAAKDLYRAENNANPFASLLCEPLEAIGVPPIVYEIRRLSMKSLRTSKNYPETINMEWSELQVLSFLITRWEGTLLALPGVGTSDLSNTVRRACLRLGQHDSGNSIFQSIVPLLYNQVHGTMRDSSRATYTVEVFPNIVDGYDPPSRRKAILATDGIGFTAFINILEFCDVISRLRPETKLSQRSPSSATASPASPFPPNPTLSELINVEFLAAHCAWSLELGKNSLRLNLLGSDGSLEGEGLTVDPSVEIRTEPDSLHVLNDIVIRLPQAKLRFPSHPRVGRSSTSLSPCFAVERLSCSVSKRHEELVHVRSPVLTDISGFDDKRLCQSKSGHLLLKLLVKLDSPTSRATGLHSPPLSRSRLATPPPPASIVEEFRRDNTASCIESLSDSHRRTASLPLVKVIAPDSVMETEPDQTVLKTKKLDASSNVVHHKQLRALPTPPAFEFSTVIRPNETAIQDFNSHRSLSKQHSLPSLHHAQSSALKPSKVPQNLGRIVSHPNSLHSEPQTPLRRPLPRRPSLSIDTINLTPPSSNYRFPGRSVLEQESTPIQDMSSELKTVGATRTGDDSNNSSTNSNAVPQAMASTSAPFNSSLQTLTPTDGRLHTSLHPLTPGSDTKHQDVSPDICSASDLKLWRSNVFLQIEGTFGVHLPADRFSDWQSMDDEISIYPMTTRYLAQYLHWWEGESNLDSIEAQSANHFLSQVRQLTSGSIIEAIGKQGVIRDVLVGALRRTEELSYRRYRRAKLNRVWSSLLRRTLELDEQDLSLCFSSALKENDDAVLQEVAAMDLGDLQDFMDVLQSLIDRQYGPHRLLERFLQKIVDRTGVLPKYLFLSDIKRIGENPVAGGGFADVWKGKIGERFVALKVIRIFGLADPKDAQRQEFCKEAMIWRQFRHQNVLPFCGVSTEEFAPRLALVSPWMRNGDILSYLKDNDDANRVALIAGIGLGLLYLHTLKPLVVHGDLRGANVLVDDFGRPKLADFGLAKVVDSQASTVAGTSFNGKGAMRWQAPELLDSSRFGSECGITTCSDVYAFASVCLEVFTSEVPFSHLRDGQVFLEVVLHDRRPGRPPADSHASQRGLSDGIWTLMESCWSANPSARPHMRIAVEELTVDCP